MSNAARPTLKLKKEPSLASLIDAAAPAEAAPAPEPEAPESRAERRAAEEQYEPASPTTNPRNEALNRMAAAAQEELGYDGAVPLDERTHLERQAAEETAQGAGDAPDGDAEDPAVPFIPDPNAGGDGGAAPVPAADAAVKTHKVDVRGQVAEIPEDKVLEAGLHALRHHGAAEMALREANALLSQARAVAGPAQPQPAQEQAPASTTEDVQRLAEALQFGSKEDAAKAVAAMMNRGVASGDVQDVVARTVETRVRDVLDQDKAAKQLESLVPEMLSDRRVLALMATEERAARAAGDARPYTQLYPEIGQKIRGWIDSMKAPPAPAGGAPAAPTIAARAAAKAAVPSAVVARGAAPVAPAATRAPTGSEIVAQMRAKRGQRQYI